MYLVYKTDNQHSFKSRDIIGVVDELNNAIDICQQQAEKEECEILTDDIFNLGNIKQTQNYQGDGEFVIEEITINELL